MIRIENMSKKIRGRTVLDGIDYTFRDGMTYGLKGINGSGKTMLMRVVSGLIYPTEGRVLVDGKELGKDVSFPESIGILIENPVFLDAYTGFGNLKLLASLNDRAGDEDIREILQKIGLDPDDTRKYRKYSLGMKQRLGIAAALMEKPKILLLDEPFNALDTDGVARFSRLIREEQERGTLILLACHEEGKLEEFADVVLHMEDGRIVREEEVDG